MTRPTCLRAGFAALCLFSVAALTAAEPGPWVSIFNGKDLTGWTAPAASPFWRVEKGVLIGESDEKLTGSMLKTEKKYGDFILELDARWQGDPDSGVFVREPALQVQIGTSISRKIDLTGSFYLAKEGGYPEHAQAKNAAKLLKPGDWNTLRLEARGDTFKVSINGTPASQYTNAAHAAPGAIGVQIHQKLKMKVEFRNIRVAEIR
jgi:hypothetical protein